MIARQFSSGQGSSMSVAAFLRHNARWLAGGFALTFFSSYGQTFFIALSAGHIRAEYGLTHGQFGGLYMLATLGSALMLPHVGRLIDHMSVARVAVIVIACLALASLSMALSSSIVLLVLTLLCLRLFGQGMMTHTCMTAMGRWFSAQRGKAVALSTLGLQLGEALFPSLFVLLFAAVGWRIGWLLAAASLVLLALPLAVGLLRVPRTPRVSDGEERHRPAREWTRAEVLRDPIFWIAMLGILAPGFIGTTIFFHQVYLVELRGWELEVFARAFAGMALMTVVFSLVTGMMVDRFSAVALLPALLVPLTLACFVLAVATPQWSAFVSMGLVGVSYGVSSTLFGALWPEVYGLAHLGSIRSAIVAMTVFGTALGPGMTGMLIDQGVSYPAQLAAMGIYCIAASIALTIASRRIRARNPTGQLSSR